MSEILVKKTSNKKYFKYSECKEGQVLVEKGTLVAIVENKYGGNNYEFREESGEVVSLNPCKALEKAMVGETLGSDNKFKIVYNRKDVVKTGARKGKDFHNIDIYEYAKPTSGENSKQLSFDDLT